ncbi:MAG: 5-(carboxyamino)imidazole ribonucleotide mutase [Stygiobacter sp. RIFOXYC12_FULL_38_8]|nr:MAG: 5-(carboxyamino)imidazole ribonucleotide mutase [Stygiobacter sp. GWC2_38_9]OGU77815.1 MAG: 5-(carboxyamino)imidazole ribonucleotide mutase [Stygiobacter sp. RIFOXYA12_FULL_38_9]OGV06033.1 MAG: 5-(carboxyamino)imidazole ribonucleotide mutase [Stygiobacter sp. RIFOXYB2_FULL_37_11]OGV13094.1 MAG: 5-(carboxyamino)imidazole ribonucleotide mutase [Stygiobacter sp. RIFOXYA2_FULL_38_8]OGV16903.1 MAG: 5-(carboxyamino)imidazole ribonucleotide mutase [Stygiobacter sp. RIFOXYC2_FULL_38_25]OGV2543
MAAKPVVGIIMGSDSDLPVMEKAFDVCKEFSVPFEVRIISAHRTPLVMKEYAETAIKRGLKVIIAGAGGAAHLAGVAASFTILPIIGVPVQSKSLNGLDSLLSMVQMPPGVPVATVAIDGAKNAALLAVQILALSDKVLAKKFSDYKVKMEKEVIAKDKAATNKYKVEL